jgi:hypothetical protein
MERRGLSEALTADRDFEQAGLTKGNDVFSAEFLN